MPELTAARRLAAGDDQQIERRLRIMAPRPHWRNTWVFLAGRLFSEGPDHRRELPVPHMLRRRSEYPTE